MPCRRHRPASWVESARALQAAAVRSPPCAVPSPNAAAHSAAARHSLFTGIAPACGDTIPRSPMCRSALSRRGSSSTDSQMRRCAPNQLAANAVGVPRCRSPFCHRPLCKSGRASSWSVPAIVALQYRIATRAIPGGAGARTLRGHPCTARDTGGTPPRSCRRSNRCRRKRPAARPATPRQIRVQPRSPSRPYHASP